MKFSYVIGVFALAFSFSCNNTPSPEQTKVVEKETVKVVQVKPETVEKVTVKAEPVKVVVEEEKGTSVKISSDGASLKTSKVEIDLKK